ncbi:MAG: hypothetical protein JJU37_10240 [Balneolaceae bacterium]|nr:hypothetical protein [Balneolaceae bacterium]
MKAIFQYGNLLFILIFIVSCSTSTDADSNEDLYRDGIHTGILESMGEETFKKFENELNMTIHRGENPPDIVAALENVHGPGKNNELFGSDLSTIFAYTFGRQRIVTANTGVSEVWVPSTDAGYTFMFSWHITPYDYDPVNQTIESRHWIHHPYLWNICGDISEIHICELSGNTEWAYVMGDESNFTISGLIRIYWQEYDIEGVTFVEYSPYMDVYIVYSGTLSNRGVDNPELGVIMHEVRDEELLDSWPEGAGFRMISGTGYNEIMEFDLEGLTPWPE